MVFCEVGGGGLCQMITVSTKESDGYNQQYIEKREHATILLWELNANRLLILSGG